jgi:CheY-like chemotaxis protein
MPARLSAVKADPTRLRQILYNLISNAIKFTPAGGSVRVAGRNDGAMVELTVADTGMGIATEDLPRLFSEFEQLSQPAALRSQGTGLGLAVTRRLVELHGGTIAVRSQLGAGTTFTVRLPIVRSLADDRASAGDTTPATVTSLVLVVDDDPPSLKLAAGLLRHAGHRVIEAAGVAEAAGVLHDLQPHLVVTDLRMPHGGGQAILAKVRAHPALAATPVVVMTAHGDRTDLLTLGFDGYVAKPLEREGFLQLIRALLAATGRSVH